MSSSILLDVIARSQQKGVPYTVLLILANHANPCCGVAWPKLDTLARECRISKRYLIACLHMLEHDGELIIVRQVGRKGGNLYFPMPQTVHSRSPVDASNHALAITVPHEKRCPLARMTHTQKGELQITFFLREKVNPRSPFMAGKGEPQITQNSVLKRNSALQPETQHTTSVTTHHMPDAIRGLTPDSALYKLFVEGQPYNDAR